MDRSRSSILGLFAVAGLILLLVLPSLAEADGGPILSDPELWALIDEGQQIAVVQLQQDGTCQVDLFVSMADRSGQSHEVIFFLPLGIEPGDFGVVEETSLEFDYALTEPIEEEFEAESRRQDDFRERLLVALLLGTLTTHAAWLSPAGLIPLFLLTGMHWGIGAAPPPVATFETPSSQVAIYDLDSETDLQALIKTTGLDPKVKETLAALEGQQIAIVKLQTQPVSAEGESESSPWHPTDQPGIHLGWRSTLVPHSAGATYSYPLGTGKAWASPIELTRVYVVSPPELDFRVEYPRLGVDLSGMWETRYGGLAQQVRWKIDDAKDPGFAVDEAYGDFGHIWRATYIKSNSGQDLVVTLLPDVSPEMQRAIRRAKVREVSESLTWFIAPLAGLIVWVTSWRVVIRRHLGVPYRWREGRLYRDALTWVGLYLITNLVAVPSAAVVRLLIPLAILAALGLVNAFLYARWKAEKLQVTRGRAFGAYMLTVLMANVLYLAFAIGYYAIVGAI
jgi:hypothetical protein